METTIQEHRHNGIGDQRINFSDLQGFIRTVSSVPTRAPRNISEQFVIYVSGATYRLYWYDTNANVWHYITATA